MAMISARSTSLTRGRAFGVLVILCASASAGAAGMQMAAVHAPRLRTACVIVHHLRGGAPPIKRSPSQLEEFFKGVGNMMRSNHASVAIPHQVADALAAIPHHVANALDPSFARSIQQLEEDVMRKETEIATLQAAMEKSKQEAKATIAEATQSIRALEEDVGRKKAKIVSLLQAVMEKSKQEASK